MSTKEIASLAVIGLSAKGVGSVLERMKNCIREQILRPAAKPAKSKSPQEIVLSMLGLSIRG
jgi:hypothetical protein